MGATRRVILQLAGQMGLTGAVKVLVDFVVFDILFTNGANNHGYLHRIRSVVA